MMRSYGRGVEGKGGRRDRSLTDFDNHDDDDEGPAPPATTHPLRAYLVSR